MIADVVGVRGIDDAFHEDDAVDGHKQSTGERAMDGAFGLLSLITTALGIKGALPGAGPRPASPSSVDAFMKGRRDGEILSNRRLDRLETFLDNNKVKLERNADDYLTKKGGPNAAAQFTGRSDGTGTLYIRNNATRYEVMHELQHFFDFKNLGFSGYKNLGELGRELSVFDSLKKLNRWMSLTPAERASAVNSIQGYLYQFLK